METKSLHLARSNSRSARGGIVDLIGGKKDRLFLIPVLLRNLVATFN